MHFIASKTEIVVGAALAAVIALVAGGAVAASQYGQPRAPYPNHIQGHALDTGASAALDCAPIQVKLAVGDASQFQCRSLTGGGSGTVVGTASFADGRHEQGAIECGDIATDMAPPQRYPLACVWLPGATDASLRALPRP